MSGRLATEFNLTQVSYDELLSTLGFNQERMTVQDWRALHKKAAAATSDVLNRGGSAIVDDTFPKRFLRDRFRQVAEEYCADFLIVEMVASVETLKKRTQKNLTKQTRRHVPWNLIEQDIEQFEHPAPDEPVVKIPEADEFGTTVQRLRAAMNNQ